MLPTVSMVSHNNCIYLFAWGNKEIPITAIPNTIGCMNTALPADGEGIAGEHSFV